MGINETNLVDKIIVEDKLEYKSKENSTIWQKAARTSSSRKAQQSNRKQYQALQELLAASLPAAAILTPASQFLQQHLKMALHFWKASLLLVAALFTAPLLGSAGGLNQVWCWCIFVKVAHSVIISACVCNYTGSPALIPGFNECIFNSRRYAFGEVFHPVVEVDGVSQSRLCIRCTCQPVSCRHAQPKATGASFN